MTALATSNRFPAQCDAYGARTSQNLEDRFWAAFNFAIDDRSSFERDDGVLYSEGHDTYAAFEKTGLPPLINQNDLGRSYVPISPQQAARPSGVRAKPYRQEQHRNRKDSGSLRLEVPSSTPFVSAVITPTSRSPVPTTAVRTHWHLPSPGGIVPSSPALELVSNFLDSIVRLSDSRSSTPATTMTNGEDGEVLIVESEVLINVIEDLHRTAIDSPLKTRDEYGLEKLHIAPPSTVAIPGGGGYDLPTAFVANGPAGCAQELDALSWMSWDRQLSNVQHAIWH
jgi:hypothetical protein